MISLTNDAYKFFENEQSEVIIYGAGNAGYWIGYYMNRCGMDFSFYIDKKVWHDGSMYNGKPVCLPEILKGYSGCSIRIIVSPTNYEAVLADLIVLEQKYGFNALCFVPRYFHLTTKVEGYHINQFLAYFRRKLFKGEIPTIISNDCSAGYIYQIMGMVMISPTINTAFDQDDFIKLCKAPEHYLEMDVGDLHWVRSYGNPQTDKDCLAGRLGDITVYFAHENSTEGLAERWKQTKKRMNLGRIIAVANSYDRNNPPFSVKNETEFMKLNYEHLMIVDRNTAFWGNPGFNKIYMQQNYLSRRDTAIENYFDLLGWLNREYINDVTV